MNGSARRGQLKESAKVLGSFNTHDEALQLFALILADDIAAQRRELHDDFFLRHWIARITLGNIDACDLPLLVVMVTRLLEAALHFGLRPRNVIAAR